ncbi:hypothetical protein BH24CHL5_BH24CHL5_09030 [soil metagenome]
MTATPEARAGLAQAGPSLLSRLYGLGSVYGKTLRDSRWTVLGLGLVVGLLTLATGFALADQFDTEIERQLLALQMESLPAIFRGLIGEPVNLHTLPGFLSWRLMGFLPLMIGVWSVVAMSGTIAGEAARKTLELVLSLPISRRSLAIQKVIAHVSGVAIVIIIVSAIAALGSPYLATLPGDEIPFADALAELALVGSIALFAGSIAFALGPLVGRALAGGIGAAWLFGSYVVNGFAELVPGFGLLRNLSVFYWTTGHRPMAGVSDWPAVIVVAALAVVLFTLGVVLFERRDLATQAALPARISSRVGRLRRGRVAAGRWSLAGPGRRSLAERLPAALGWGGALGLYGFFVAMSSDAFAQTITAVPQIAELIRQLYPDFDFTTTGGILQLAIFAFVTLMVGLAAAGLVAGWASDEREGRLEIVLAAPLRRGAWALRSGLGLISAVLLMGAPIDLGPAIGAAAPGDPALSLLGGGLVLGVYGAALVGIGILVAGFGRPRYAGLAVGGVAFTFYLLDLLGTVLRLPDDVLNLSLTQHLGEPMAGTYDVPGTLAAAAVALAGLLVGAWAFARRDLHLS